MHKMALLLSINRGEMGLNKMAGPDNVLMALDVGGAWMSAIDFDHGDWSNYLSPAQHLSLVVWSSAAQILMCINVILPLPWTDQERDSTFSPDEMSVILRDLLGLTRLRVIRTLVCCFISQTKVQWWTITKGNNDKQTGNFSQWTREGDHQLTKIIRGDRLISVGTDEQSNRQTEHDDHH